MIAHPFEILPGRIRRWLLYLALVASVVLGGYQIYLDVPLHTAAAPQGIVSYELARTQARAAAILESWRVPEKALEPVDPNVPGRLDQIIVSQPRYLTLRAFDQLVFDFLFLISYALVLSLGALWASELGVAPGLGVAFAWLAWVAALADAIENTLLLRQIGLGASESAASGAFVCAVLKFILTIGALEYIAWATWKTDRRPVAVTAQIVALALLAPIVQTILRG